VNLLEDKIISCNKFSREDLEQVTDSKSIDAYSINSENGSQAGLDIDTPDNQLAGIASSKHSPFWKRVDMRQKKVIRGL